MLLPVNLSMVAKIHHDFRSLYLQNIKHENLHVAVFLCDSYAFSAGGNLAERTTLGPPKNVPLILLLGNFLLPPLREEKETSSPDFQSIDQGSLNFHAIIIIGFYVHFLVPPPRDSDSVGLRCDLAICILTSTLKRFWHRHWKASVLKNYCINFPASKVMKFHIWLYFNFCC